MNKFLSQTIKGIQNLAPYIPGKPIEEIEREYHVSDIIKLASNENPYGPSPNVVNKLAEFASSAINISLYPDGSGFQLKNLIAKQYHVSSNQITLGNGSNDVLDMICRCFASKGDEVLFSQYAFAVYSICTQAVGAKSVITKAKNWGHDLDAMLAAITNKTKLIFIANPNNPTGSCLTGLELYAFLKQVPKHIIVVIDEAYMEYASHKTSPYKDSYTPAHLWLDKFDNLMVTRTFSKAYGLAGLRIGYSLSCADISELLNRVRQPFNSNSFALEAAMVAFLDVDYLHQVVKKNWEQMHYIELELNKLNISYIPSAGNFLCVDVSSFSSSRTVAEINELLLHDGIITRPVGNYNMLDHLRITIGSHEENQRLIASFKSILS